MVCIMNKNNNYVNLNIELPKPVVHAIGLLESAGFEAWVVGGAVRDAMIIARMQVENLESAEQDHAEEGPSDWDLTTDALPDEMPSLVICTFVWTDYHRIAFIQSYCF